MLFWTILYAFPTEGCPPFAVTEGIGILHSTRSFFSATHRGECLTVAITAMVLIKIVRSIDAIAGVSALRPPGNLKKS